MSGRFPNQLKALRESRGVSLRDFGRQLGGLSHATLSRAENGKLLDPATAAVLGPIVGLCPTCEQTWPGKNTGDKAYKPSDFQWINRPVRVKGEDFSYEALCLCSFPKSSGKVRYVVEDNGRLFVQRREQLTFLDVEPRT